MSVVGGEDIVVTASSPNQEAALEFVRFTQSELFQVEMVKTGQMTVLPAYAEQQNAIAPFYATFADPWTANQGWLDYSVGGSGLDILAFYEEMYKEGTNVGPNSSVSFQKDFLEPVEKMQLLAANYTQADANARTYDFGNVAFANGGGAMYMQGPWAISEIGRINADTQVGSFPLPMTNDPNDLKVRVNMDLVNMIPKDAKNPDGARAFMEYLYQPEIIQAYNNALLGFVPTTGAADPDDPRIEGMIQYYNDGAVYQGPSVLNPKAIPTENFAQSLVLGANASIILATMDADWARLAYRTSAGTDQGGADK